MVIVPVGETPPSSAAETVSVPPTFVSFAVTFSPGCATSARAEAAKSPSAAAVAAIAPTSRRPFTPRPSFD
jgi:hypothetical protein